MNPFGCPRKAWAPPGSGGLRRRRRRLRAPAGGEKEHTCLVYASTYVSASGQGSEVPTLVRQDAIIGDEGRRSMNS